MSANSSAKPRLLGLDVAKLIAMFQVVFIHFSFYTNNFANTGLSRAVTSLTVTCVPLFIAVNGALLLNRPYSYKKHIARTVKYVLLLFFWRLVHITTYFILGAPRLSLPDLLALLVAGSIDGYPLGHFWFLYALIGLYLLFPLIKLAWDRDRDALVPICVSIAVLFCGVDLLRTVVLFVSPIFYERFTPFFGAFASLNPLSSVGYLVLYFIGGAYIAEPYMKINRAPLDWRNRMRVSRVICLLGLSWLITCMVHETQYTNGSPAFGVDYGYWLPTTVVATFSLLLALLKVGFRSGGIVAVTSKLGGSTFAVYMLHMPALLLLARIESGYLASHFTGNLLFAAQLLLSAMLYIFLIVLGTLLKRIPLVSRLL